MAEHQGFDLPPSFDYKGAVSLAMDAERFRLAQEALGLKYPALSIGVEVVRRAAAHASPGRESYYGLGAQLYTLSIGCAEHAGVVSNELATPSGAERAKKTGAEILHTEETGRFNTLIISSLEEMRFQSPVLAEFLQQLSRRVLTEGEDDPDQCTIDMMYGAALLRRVHLSSEKPLKRRLFKWR